MWNLYMTLKNISEILTIFDYSWSILIDYLLILQYQTLKNSYTPLMTGQTHIQERLASSQIHTDFQTKETFKMTINITVIITDIRTFIPIITTFKYFPKINSLSQIQLKSQKLIKSNSLSHLRHRHSKILFLVINTVLVKVK